MLCGVYQDGTLSDTITSQEPASQALAKILSQLLAKHKITKIIYANGPGSYMGLKVAYVMLKSYCIVKGIELYGVSGYELNQGAPIRASKTMSFVRTRKNKSSEQGTSLGITQDGYEISLQNCAPGEFSLPLNLNSLKLSSDNLPQYFTKAV